ncbi:MAG TPA: cytochrome c-type biogenesis CcmF C-terminal domain-containing protein, partial [Candidatus Manganitrophaceae bacterium]|nr:cytochrome c-type biogenesis CcmF C-terminal domain-containing protein [Candidatus Manganitrophaceae bacterium]
LVRLYGAEGVNWSGREGFFNVYRGDLLIAQLRPQKRFYSVSQTPTTETAIYQVKMGHIFLTIPEVAPDDTWARVRALHNPLVLWVWYGGAIMGFGAILNIFRPRRRDLSAPRPAAVASEETLAAPQTEKVGASTATRAVSSPPRIGGAVWRVFLSALRPGRKEI